MKPRILIVEDEEALREELVELLGAGADVRGAGRCAEAVSLAMAWRPSVVLLDYRLPDGTGLDVLQTLKAEFPHLAVVVMTAFPDVKIAVDLMKQGAYDYVVKPFELDELQNTMARALDASSLRSEVQYLRRRVRASMDSILGHSPVIRRVLAEIESVAPAPATPVFITGESGTGKELVANYIHYKSPRASAPLIRVNAGGLPAGLVESELFGHEKGAFTGAQQRKRGLVEEADGGTLFLDEISEMGLDLQPKLLRFLENGTFLKVGGTKEMSVDVRVLSATNRDPHALVAANHLRSDLYYRLAVIHVQVPPLRDRGDDVLLIAQSYLGCFAQALRKPALRFAPEAEAKLLAYPWPGNIRELKNVMERAALFATGEVVGVELLPEEVRVSPSGRSSVVPGSLRAAERERIREVLASTRFNKTQAAKVLGISRVALRAKIHRLGIKEMS